jgi:hypothetical protein
VVSRAPHQSDRSAVRGIIESAPHSCSFSMLGSVRRRRFDGALMSLWAQRSGPR